MSHSLIATSKLVCQAKRLATIFIVFRIYDATDTRSRNTHNLSIKQQPRFDKAKRSEPDKILYI